MDTLVAKISTLVVLGVVAVAGFALAITGSSLGYSGCNDLSHAVCGEASSFQKWWPLSLQGAVTITIFGAMKVGMIERELMTALGFLVLSTSVLMSSVNDALSEVVYGKNTDDIVHAELAAAGYVLLILSNCAGIVILGLQFHKSEKRSVGPWSVPKIVSTTVLLFLVLVGWGLMLGGSIPARIKCQEDSCKFKGYFTWWTIAFELAVTIWAVVVLILGYFEKMVVPIAAFITLVTANLMDEADKALTDLVSLKWTTADDAFLGMVAAGVLILCMMNIVVLIVLSWAAVVKDTEEGDAPEAPSQRAWVVSTGVIILPLLLGLGMALTGIARFHTTYCEDKDLDCKVMLRSSYWATFFELAVIVGILCLALIKREAIPRVRGFVEAFLVLASIETMREVGELLERNEVEGRTSQAIAAAGFMMVTAMNFVIMLVVGCETAVEADPSGYQPAPV